MNPAPPRAKAAPTLDRPSIAPGPRFTLATPFDTPGGPGLVTEWLLTDGRGGFAMGSAAGVPTRRYHALFIAATKPPVGRVALLNATVDQLIVSPDTPQAMTVELSSFRFAGDAGRLHPDGASRVSSFARQASAQWTFDLPMARVTRTLHLHRDRVAATLRYTVERRPAGGGAARSPGGASPPALRLSIRPLVSLRDMHTLIRRAWADRFHVEPSGDGRSVRVERDGVALRLRASDGGFRHDQQWWFDFLYSEDAARGQDSVEDLFSPGVFTLEVPANRARAELLVRASIDDLPAPGAGEVERDEDACFERRAAGAGNALATAAAAGAASTEVRGWLAALSAAADDFVVARGSASDGKHGSSVIAGYPWFSDWGRDTFVSLPGLMLATGRFDEARATLLEFAAHRRGGLIPNVFNDQTGQAEYNTVDGSLWFIHAACAWRDETLRTRPQRAGAAGADESAWTAELLPACLDIIANYRRGTGGQTNIAMDPFDKLVTAGTSATQLTWMDARRDGVTFTPRHGKAVEINALWISALRRLGAAMPAEQGQQAANLTDLAGAASRSFRAAFWNGKDNCLYDTLTPSDSERGPVTWTPDASIRPNQIFAVSLPFSPLSAEQQQAVIACVSERLLTPAGVRTLDPRDRRYCGRYEGNLFQRDGAYHQGTAWPWLLGPLAEAVLRAGAFSDASRQRALGILRPLLSTLEPDVRTKSPGGGCLGQVAEIFDGDAPQRPQGCPAQAWSVAELLRVLILASAPAPAPAATPRRT